MPTVITPVSVRPFFLLSQSARSELLALLDKPALKGIPLLVLGNKNDLPGAVKTQQLIDKLGLKVQTLWVIDYVCVSIAFVRLAISPLAEYHESLFC